MEVKEVSTNTLKGFLTAVGIEILFLLFGWLLYGLVYGLAIFAIIYIVGKLTRNRDFHLLATHGKSIFKEDSPYSSEANSIVPKLLIIFIIWVLSVISATNVLARSSDHGAHLSFGLVLEVAFTGLLGSVFGILIIAVLILLVYAISRAYQKLKRRRQSTTAENDANTELGKASDPVA